jgi:sugar lactone lactonase YvrE
VTAVPPNQGTPTGAVDFVDEVIGTDLGTVPLKGGVATLSTTTLGLGTHVITAHYSGDTNFQPCSPTVGPGSIVNTLAGGGTDQDCGDGGPASNAGVQSPFAVAVDAAGDVFISEEMYGVVREINRATGVITTVAGNGTMGASGDGGPATAASLWGPDGLAVDNGGHLFIAEEGDIDINDTQHSRVREVDLATGLIATVAGTGTAGYAGDGGQATAAELNGPSGLAVAGAGHLFIADCNNNRVREVNLSTGVITTVAGIGTPGYRGDGGQATAAPLAWPAGVAVDSSGDLFIADTYHNRILELSTSGVLTTVVGSGLLFPSGVAVDSSGDLFIADTWHNRVIEYNTSGVTSTVASGLLLPSGVAVDSAGDVFIADTWHERVVEVSAAGVFSTVVGSGLLLPTGVAVDNSGDLFIADTYHSRVLEVNATTGATIQQIGANYPTGVAVDAAGNLFIAETAFSNCVVEVSGGVVTTVAGSGSYGYGGDGGPATNAKLFLYWFPTFASGIAVDSSDDLFIADTINCAVREVPAV